MEHLTQQDIDTLKSEACDKNVGAIGVLAILELNKTMAQVDATLTEMKNLMTQNGVVIRPVSQP